MNAPQTIHPADVATSRPSAAVIDRRHTWCVTYDTPGMSWEYSNAVHESFRFHEDWPEGLLVYLLGESEAGHRSAGIWTGPQAEQAFFAKIAIDVLTDSVHELGAPASDFEPVGRSVNRLLLTPDCYAFADIGPDPDGASVRALGTDPATVRIDITALDLPDHASAAEQLGSPDGLLMAMTEDEAGGAIETQVWASEKAAREALNEIYLPALAGICEREPEPAVNRLRRISFSRAELNSAFER
ncbi:MAG: hypothetical protein QM648_02535 [Solirubrobacterales bacterium]